MGEALAGHAAIVTGGARGPGRAIAAALVAGGAHVIVADNGTSPTGDGVNPTVARDVAQTLGRATVAFGESVASPGAARQLVDLAVRTFGGLDIVVNSAMIRREADVRDLDPVDWDAVIRNNLGATFHVTRAAIDAMQRHGRRGRIVNVVDETGVTGAVRHAAQASSMAAVIALTRTTALDLEGSGITANAVVCHGAAAGTAAAIVAALCQPAAGGITGRVFGARDGEVLHYGTPRTAPAEGLLAAPAEVA